MAKKGPGAKLPVLVLHLLPVRHAAAELADENRVPQLSFREYIITGSVEYRSL